MQKTTFKKGDYLQGKINNSVKVIVTELNIDNYICGYVIENGSKPGLKISNLAGQPFGPLPADSFELSKSSLIPFGQGDIVKSVNNTLVMVTGPTKENIFPGVTLRDNDSTKKGVFHDSWFVGNFKLIRSSRTCVFKPGTVVERTNSRPYMSNVTRCVVLGPGKNDSTFTGMVIEAKGSTALGEISTSFYASLFTEVENYKFPYISPTESQLTYEEWSGYKPNTVIFGKNVPAPSLNTECKFPTGSRVTTGRYDVIVSGPGDKTGHFAGVCVKSDIAESKGKYFSDYNESDFELVPHTWQFEVGDTVRVRGGTITVTGPGRDPWTFAGVLRNITGSFYNDAWVKATVKPWASKSKTSYYEEEKD